MRSGRRHSLRFMVLVIIMTLMIPATAGAATEELSIDQAVKLAQTSNPQLTSLSLQVDRAQVLRDDSSDNISILPTGDLLVTENTQAMVNSYEQNTITLDSLKKQRDSEHKRVEKEVISAYATALVNANKIEATKLTLQEMEKQGKLSDLAQKIGMVSNYDNSKYAMSIEQAQDNLDMLVKEYDSSISTLRSLLNKGTDWQPQLTSKAIISEYEREKLDTEFVRAISESADIQSAEQELKMEQIKIYWPGFDGQDRYLDQIGMQVKELAYEKTKRSTLSSVEQLYYGMDSLQTQIELSAKVVEQKEKDLKQMELKYELGLISLRSLESGGSTLEAARIEVQKAKLDLNSYHAQLASNKANYAYITGKTVYSKLDWQ